MTCMEFRWTPPTVPLELWNYRTSTNRLWQYWPSCTQPKEILWKISHSFISWVHCKLTKSPLYWHCIHIVHCHDVHTHWVYRVPLTYMYSRRNILSLIHIINFLWINIDPLMILYLFKCHTNSDGILKNNNSSGLGTWLSLNTAFKDRDFPLMIISVRDLHLNWIRSTPRSSSSPMLSSWCIQYLFEEVLILLSQAVPCRLFYPIRIIIINSKKAVGADNSDPPYDQEKRWLSIYN